MLLLILILCTIASFIANVLMAKIIVKKSKVINESLEILNTTLNTVRVNRNG